MKTYRLEELATIKRGASPRPIQDPRWFAESGHGWVRISDVTRSDRVLLETTQYLSDEGRSASVEIAPGDLIMSICATIGRPLFSGINACIHDGFVAFKNIRRELVDPDYLYYFLKMNEEHFDSLSQPGTQKNLNSRLVGGTEIALPALDEQQRIAEVLRSANEAVRTAEAARRAAASVFRASLDEMFDGNASDWPTVRLGVVAEFVNGRGFKPHEWETTGLPIIRIQNLNGGTDFNFYSGAYNPKILVRTGELLFAWSGSRGTSFGPHIWNGPEGLLNYHTWKVVPKSKLDTKFLYFSLLRLTKQIEEEAHGASALVHTQKATIVDYETNWPSLDVRMEVTSALAEMEDARSAANVAFEKARTVCHQVASDLLSGRVRVPA